MDNIQLDIDENDVLTLKIDLKKSLGYTRCGQSVRIASTLGNLQLWKDGAPHPRGIKINLNAYRPITRGDRF